MGSSSLQDLTPDTRKAAERLIAQAADAGIAVKVASTLRTCTEQDQLYAQGRTTEGIVVTQNPGCRSWHVFGRALDLRIRNDDGSLQLEADPRYAKLGAMAEALGFEWGGNLEDGDAGHFEFHPGLDIENLCPRPEECQLAVARYGSSGNYYIPDDLAKETAQEVSGINVRDVIISALLGAVVFQVVSYGIRKIGER